MTAAEQALPAAKPPASYMDYVMLARPDHATKHVFILPGIALAWLLRGVRTENLWLSVLAGLVTAVCIASANYVINEYLDRESDKHHPTKSARASVQRDVKGSIVIAEWVALVCVGLFAAYLAGPVMLCVAVAFALQGIVYNVPPIRTKDKRFLDVLSEAVNNPFRLLIGWAMVDPTTLPPSSIILAYWFGGAFLMGAKRLSEYREITASHGKELLARYRKSFATYSEISLNVSCFLYALISVSLISIFLIKYRIEYILLLPGIVLIFGKYLAMSMRPGSAAQAPENLYKEHKLLAGTIVLAAMFFALTVMDLPWLEEYTSQRYIALEPSWFSAGKRVVP